MHYSHFTTSIKLSQITTTAVLFLLVFLQACDLERRSLKQENDKIENSTTPNLTLASLKTDSSSETPQISTGTQLEESIQKRLAAAKLKGTQQKNLVYQAHKNLTQPLASSDFAPELQRQINRLPAEGGDIVIPRGIYLLSSTVTIPKDHVTIRANGLGDVVLRLKLNPTGNPASLTAFHANGRKHLTFENLIVLSGYIVAYLQ